MSDRANDPDRPEQAMNEDAGGTRVPHLGPGVTALSGGAAPVSPQARAAMIEAEVQVPRRASGKLWKAAQYVDSRTFRATLDQIALKAFDTLAAAPNPVHDWLARAAPPMVVETWYDNYLLQAFGQRNWGQRNWGQRNWGQRDWGLTLGVRRNGTRAENFHRAYDHAGAEVDTADPAWKALIYKPHGLAKAGCFELVPDSDCVKVLTETDIQTPIPPEVRMRRSRRPLLFQGYRFDGQRLRIFARQIAKRSGAGHFALIEGPLTWMDRRFADELGITVLNLPLDALTDLPKVPEG